MQTLTAMTLAALALAGAAHFADAAWAGPPACDSREVSVYFEKDGADVDAFSRGVVQRLAQDARACPGARVVARPPQGDLADLRAHAISNAFAEQGVQVVLVGSPSVAPSVARDEAAIFSRAASLRIVTSDEPLG